MSRKKAASKTSFELTALASIEIDMDEKIDPKKLEEHMKAKEKTTRTKVEQVRCTVNEEDVTLSKPIWWPKEKLQALPYDQLKNVYTFNTDLKRICVDIADNQRKRRRIILFKVREPVESVILVEMLQKRKLYSRVYEDDNILKVEYGNWISGYSAGTLERNRTRGADGSEGEEDYPERDYPEQFEDEDELAFDTPLIYDYFNDPDIPYIREEYQIFLPGYGDKRGLSQRPGLHPSQWEALHGVPGSEGTRSQQFDQGPNLLAADKQRYLSIPGANLISIYITMFKYRPGTTATNAAMSIRHIFRACPGTDITGRCHTIRLQPKIELMEEDYRSGDHQLPAVVKSTQWVYYQAEPMSLGNPNPAGSRYAYLKAQA